METNQGNPDFRALCDELANHLQVRVIKEDREVPMEGYYSQGQQLIDRTRAALAEPQPPADGEVRELAARLRAIGNDYGVRHSADCRRAAELLEQLAAPQPIPVSERLPGPGDCDAEGRCWWEFAGSDDYGPAWTLMKMHGIPFDMTRWLPAWAHALPLPSVKEVDW